MSATARDTPYSDHSSPRLESAASTATAHGLVASVLSRFRFSAGILVVLIIVGTVMGAIGRSGLHQVIDSIGFDLQALKGGRLYLLFPGTFVQDKPWLPWKILLLVAITVPPLEWVLGSRRAAITFFVTDWVGTLLSVPILVLAATLGSSRADVYMHTPDVGSSSAAFGCVSAFAASLPGMARGVVTSFLFAYLLRSLILVKHVYSVEHLISAVAGFALGLFFARSPPATAEETAAF